MNVVNLKRRPARLECSSCGAGGEGTCDCGAPYVPAVTRAAQAVAENPGMSDRAIAAELGVSDRTVNRARNSGATHDAPESRTGKDGKKYPAKRKPHVVPDDNEMPSEDEAHESWQQDLYDQACFLLERMESKRRQKLFAYIKRKYPDEI